MTEFGLRLAISLTQIAAVMGVVVVTVLILTLAERKSGLDAGPHGADGSGAPTAFSNRLRTPSSSSSRKTLFPPAPTSSCSP